MQKSNKKTPQKLHWVYYFQGGSRRCWDNKECTGLTAFLSPLLGIAVKAVIQLLWKTNKVPAWKSSHDVLHSNTNRLVCLSVSKLSQLKPNFPHLELMPKPQRVFLSGPPPWVAISAFAWKQGNCGIRKECHKTTCCYTKCVWTFVRPYSHT